MTVATTAALALALAAPAQTAHVTSRGLLVRDRAPRVTGGTRRQRLLLRRVARGVGVAPIRRIRIAAAPAPWKPNAKLGLYGHLWLRIDIAQDATPAATAESRFAAREVAGGFRELAHRTRLGDLLGFTMVSGGQSHHHVIATTFGRRSIRRPPAQAFAIVRRRLAPAVLRAGADATVGFVRPDALAPIAVVTARRPREIIRYIATHRWDAAFAGSLIEVFDTRSRLVLAAEGRDRAGTTFVANGYR